MAGSRPHRVTVVGAGEQSLMVLRRTCIDTVLDLQPRGPGPDAPQR
ncbi:hypothetical protein [Kineococcus sp. SYSU DK003]